MPLFIIKNNKIGTTYTRNQKGEASILTEEYLLEVQGGSAPEESITAVSQTPYTGAGDPDFDKPIIRTRCAMDNRFVCTDIKYKHIQPYMYGMTVTYTALLDVGSTDEEDDLGGNSFYCKISRRGTFRMVPLWKFPSTFPTNFTAAWPPTAGIIGTNVDIMGVPENTPCWHTNISIELYLNKANQYATEGNANYWPAFWENNLFKRNSTTFLGYPTGIVVFKGFNEAPTNDPWSTFTLDFEADSIGHLEQKVLPNVTGGVLLTNTVTWGSSVIKQANQAYWYQPYYRYGTCDFLTLSPVGNWNELLQPTPAWP